MTIHKDTIGAIVIYTIIITVMSYYWHQSDIVSKRQSYQLCDVLNNGDYASTQECIDND